MAFFRKTAAIFLFFFLGFGAAKHLKFGYSEALWTTNDEVCFPCVKKCVLAFYDESLYKCDWEDRPCICSGLRKGIDCMEACPDGSGCPKHLFLRRFKKQFVMLCPGSDRKLAQGFFG
ncbi:hypothetical protein DdX_15151 [Ditylenchus destructor]|uniref:Uncharacterized protein n=1 Tax=Ditylenchus destructor TaxID=166010 RepID=A0AAD4MQW3_9BILA|nr:hypothetical protein DdX_15151 [Ditylenchus destructor]